MSDTSTLIALGCASWYVQVINSLITAITFGVLLWENIENNDIRILTEIEIYVPFQATSSIGCETEFHSIVSISNCCGREDCLLTPTQVV